nr:Ycf1 protein [Plantago asiatica]WAB65032.1 Ycf1 protein [Plantago asiatica]
MQHLYFLFGSWIPFCIKLVNSVVVVGLYYGFLTTFSVGPSYLFLLRAQVMEKGMEKRVAATTGFISGQFIMFLSIYYPPMHLALGQPHTITVLALSYLLVHLFNDKDFLDNESSSRNSLSNFSTQSVFVNNLIFQLFHHYLFPSSMLARLVNVYLFRCNNKILFLTSSFVGWLIGWVICHILFRKWLGSGLVWIQQNNLIKSNKFIRSNKYLVAKLRIRIFSILLFMTCAYSLSRIPFPIKPSTKTEEIDVEIETSDEEDPSSFSEERADPNKIDETEEIRVNSNKNHENSTIFPKKMANNDPFFFEKNLATLLFDFNQWNRPLRYIKNDKFEQAIRNEMSHYFFDRCKSDGKYRMTFTCPASVSIFLERLKRRLLSPELWPYFFDDNPPDPYDFWIFTNEKKERKEKKAFLNRIKSLDKKSSFLNRLETRTRLCNDDSRNKYLPKRYDPLLSGSRRKTIEKINEISKKIPRWEYKLITELEQQSGEFQDIPEDFEIRSREAKEVVIFTDIKDDKDDPDEMEEMSTTRYLEQPDFDRDLIKGSVRAQRRKVVIWKVFQGNAHSPLFVYRIKKSIFFSLTSNMFELIKSIFRNRVWKGEAFQIVESTNEQTKREENRIEIEDEEKKEMEILEEEARMKIAEAWDNAHTYGQGIRACLLLIQSIFRKYILLPSFIIAKNLGRISLSQRPEWSEDFREWNREMHLKCTYNGTPLSETELPENWFIEGLQIKILFPFRLKPSHKRKLRSYQEKEDFRFLTVFGLEAKHPFGFPEKRPSFWKPVLKELGKKVRKMKKNYFKGKKKRLAKVSKENPIQLRKVEIYESNEIQEEKDSIISNQIINQSFGQTVSPGLTNSSLTEKKIKDLTERIGKIRNQIERIERIRKKKRKNDTSPNKTFNAKFLEKWKIFKRRTVRFISKFPLYLKIFIELLSRHRFFSRSEWKLSGVWKSTIYYIEEFVLFSKFYLLRIWKLILYIMFEGWFKIYYILLCIVRDIRFLLNFVVDHSNLDISTQIRLRTLIDKMMNNCIELIFLSLDLTFKNTSSNKKKKNLIPFKKSLDKIRDMKSNLHIFFDLSCVSQAYVFYKLSQMQVSNLHKLRPVLQYQGISLFLKPEIKDSLEKQGMVHSKLKLNDKKLRNYEQNQWKKWLRGYSPYNFSSIIWSRLMPEKWRNTSHCIATKEKLSKCNSYETDQVSDSKKKREVYKLANQKENFHKSYRYDLLANKFLNSEKFQGNKNGELSCNTHKDPLYDILKTTPIYNYVDMLAVEKMVNRKYLRWKSLYRKEKVDIESCITIDANRNPNIQRETNKYFQISIKNGYSEICYFRLPDNLPKFHNVFVDWMGMNERMLNYSISNLEGWFFPELVLFHQAYKTKPWFRPNQLLLLNRNGNENSSEKKKIKFKKKQGNQEEPKKGEDFGSVLSQEKSSEENSVKLDRKKKKKKKSQLDSFLERYLLFQCKWWDSTLDEKLMNNIEVYCLLLRLMDPRKILLSSIQTREIDLDRLTIQTSLTHAELLKKGILIIEPIRLFGKIDGQLLMYQTISTSLVDKSKYQTNPKYQEERYVSKNHFDFLIPENILSFRHRRKLRILISLNSKYRNDENRNLLFWNEKNRKNSNQASPENKGLNIEENALMKLKLFLWPNYRLEDLACMNRYWFNTNNGSRFSMLRIHLYPRLKMENS